METITLDEFMDLIPIDAAPTIEVGQYALGGDFHVEQCRGLRIGEEVSFINVVAEEGTLYIDEICIESAVVVEEENRCRNLMS